MSLYLGPGVTHEQPLPRLNQPLRGLVAAGEVVLAVGLIVIAVWIWGHATTAVPLPPSDNPAVPPSATSTDGRWMAAAVGLALVSGLLLLDAIRQTLLAVRTGGGR